MKLGTELSYRIAFLKRSCTETKNALVNHGSVRIDLHNTLHQSEFTKSTVKLYSNTKIAYLSSSSGL